MAIDPVIAKFFVEVAGKLIEQGFDKAMPAPAKEVLVQTFYAGRAAPKAINGVVVGFDGMPASYAAQIQIAILSAIAAHGLSAQKMWETLKKSIGDHQWSISINATDQWRYAAAWARIVTDPGDVIVVARDYLP